MNAVRLPPRGPLGSPENAKRYQIAYQAKLNAVRALKNYLRGEYQDSPHKLHSRTASATGLSLGSRLVSRLEVVSALERLDYRPRRCVELRLIAGKTTEETAEVLHVSTSTVSRDTQAALAVMAGIIFEEASSAQ